MPPATSSRASAAQPNQPPILFGSHIDSVPTGGNFDGDLGTFAALEVIQAVQAAKIQTRHPLEMVVWAHEESTAFGIGTAASRIVAGDLQAGDMDKVWNGMKRGDAIKSIAGNPDQIETAIRGKGTWHSYVELHIEQGGTLDKAKIPIGIVEGIVAIHRYDVVIEGQVNHAGTTPMNERHDAMVAAAQLTLAVRDIASRRQGRQVGTVGRIEIEPNSPNVIPGRATLSVEFRDLSEQVLRELGDAVKARGAEIAKTTGTTINFTLASTNVPAMATQRRPGRDRPRRGGGQPEHDAAAERRRSRRAADREALPDGDDLRAERRRHQPLAERTDDVGRLRERRERPAEDGARPRSARQRLTHRQRGRGCDYLLVAGFVVSSRPCCARIRSVIPLVDPSDPDPDCHRERIDFED